MKDVIEALKIIKGANLDELIKLIEGEEGAEQEMMDEEEMDFPEEEGEEELPFNV